MSGVRVGYGSFVVLQDVDLTVAGGEIVAVTGVNGAGKSTLLSCLAGLHRPTAGTVSVLGGPPRDDAAFWRAVALVADQPTWYPGLTLREHLELVRLRTSRCCPHDLDFAAAAGARLALISEGRWSRPGRPRDRSPPRPVRRGWRRSGRSSAGGVTPGTTGIPRAWCWP